MTTPMTKRSTPPPAGDDLPVMHQLAELDHLSIDQLAQRWQVLIGGDAPRQQSPLPGQTAGLPHPAHQSLCA